MVYQLTDIYDPDLRDTDVGLFDSMDSAKACVERRWPGVLWGDTLGHAVGRLPDGEIGWIINQRSVYTMADVQSWDV